MKHIFLTLSVLSTLLLIAAFVLGLNIGDPKTATYAVRMSVRYHSLTALAGLCFAALVHAIVLTYFVGTGRWMEETGQVYRLEERWRTENHSMKWRIMLGMVGCLLLLIVTGALGAAVDPGSTVDFESWGGVPADTIHFLFASTTVAVNLVMYLWEYRAIQQNSRLVNEVLAQVRRIREERGLPV